ncbi:MAG: ATP-binding protein [Bacteriovoracaceae bacterium]|nr:ATP-binding protein [Bacteriovoracaceae bacterium]
MKYLERSHKLLKLLYKKTSLLILGPRGAGKSFYISRLVNGEKGLLTINLLETDTFKKYLKAPNLLRSEVEFQLEKFDKSLIFIDEIQKTPLLLDEVHYLIEKYQHRVSFILTGSSARKLKKEKANLLAGRAIYAPFYPLNFEEIDFEKKLAKILQFGLLPKNYIEDDPDMIVRYLKAYTGTYLKEEIMQEAVVKNIEGFNTFLEVAAQMNASPVNYSKMAKQVSISDQSIKGHYQILEDTLWAHRIPAWTFSTKKQLQKAPKYYFFDNGVLNALRGELKTELQESSFRYEDLFENLVVNEIIKLNSLKEHDYNIYHYRTSEGTEIDLILQQNPKTPPIAIEIKSSTTPDASDIKTLRKFQKEYPDSKCLVLCRVSTPSTLHGIPFYPFIEGIQSIWS